MEREADTEREVDKERELESDRGRSGACRNTQAGC